MIELTINGKSIKTDEGRTVLEVAREFGVAIPTMCTHESLPAYGSCRLCIVDVKQRGKTKIQASCTLPAADGMEIQTHSERVINIRRTLIELMLARCPESKVIRELAREIGVKQCNFERVRGEQSPCLTCQICNVVKGMSFHGSDDVPSTFVNEGG